MIFANSLPDSDGGVEIRNSRIVALSRFKSSRHFILIASLYFELEFNELSHPTTAGPQPTG